MVDPKVIELKQKAREGKELTQKDAMDIFKIVKREFAKTFKVENS